MTDEYDDPTPPEIFRRLYELMTACGPNKNDCVNVLIEACIAEGRDTRFQIVRAVRELGFSNQHVNIMLDQGTGVHPEGFRWSLGASGRYKLLEAGDCSLAASAAAAPA